MKHENKENKCVRKWVVSFDFALIFRTNSAVGGIPIANKQ